MIKEYRVPLPLTVEEYSVAQQYLNSKAGKGKIDEKVEILANEPYSNETGKGQYVHKKIYFTNQMPYWLSLILPYSFHCLEEKSWISFPYSKSVFTCPFFGDRFLIVSETLLVDNEINVPNIFRLDEAKTLQRIVEYIDIANEPDDPLVYKAETDPKVFQSKKTQRGPLLENWMQTHKPMMCIYKLATCEFKYWGFQTKGEEYLQKVAVRDGLVSTCKRLYTSIDEWYGVSLEEIKKSGESKNVEINVEK